MNLFFSYARADSDFALRLAEDMRSAGVDLWIDQLDIPIGARWDESVENALRACPRLLIILSPTSVASQNVMDEVAFAIDQARTIIPVLYRSCKIPFRLSRLQHIDFTGDYDKAFTKSLTALGACAPETGRAKKRTPVILAIPLLLGTLGGSLISNWARVFDPIGASKTPNVGESSPWHKPLSPAGLEKVPRGVPEGQPWVVIGQNDVVPVETSGYKGFNGYRYGGEV